MKLLSSFALFTLVLATGCASSPAVAAEGQTAGASPKAPPQAVKVAENVYAYGSAASDYYSMFVVTSDGVVVFESVNTQHATGLLKAIRGVTKQPVKFLLHSHNHWDHASGGQVFKDAGAVTMAHIEATRWMTANRGKDMALPTQSWSGDRKDIVLGGTKIELHYLGMNHGLGMTVFVLPKQRVAYVADLVTPNRVLMSVVPDFNIHEWERSLEELLTLDFDTAVYSHNASPAAPLGKKADAAAQLQFIRDLRGAIYAEFKKGTPPMQVPSVVKVPKYKHWKMYDEWLAMNAWRILLDEFMGPFPWRPAP